VWDDVLSTIYPPARTLHCPCANPLPTCLTLPDAEKTFTLFRKRMVSDEFK